MSNRKLSLVLPMYNEEATADRVVIELEDMLQKEKLDYELVLVNNGSTDGTQEILTRLSHRSSNCRVVSVPVNHGYGWGVINGLHWASGAYLGTMGGDGQIDPADVVRVYRALLAGGYDLCKAWRITREDGAYRSFISGIFNRLFVYTFKVKCHDINGTPKIMKRKCYEQLHLAAKDWFLDAEIMLKSEALGFSIGEVPLTFKSRRGGNSHVRWQTIWEFLKNMLIYKKRGVFHESCDLVWGEGDPA